MNSRTIILSALALLATAAQAAERSEAEMQQIALSRLAPIAASRGLSAQAAVSKVLTAENLSVYENEGLAGFVVVSRDDRFSPVLGYSDDSFAQSTANPALQWWLKTINKSLSHRAGKKKFDFTPVDNFVTTLWGQGSPFNSNCPKIQNISCLTGCAATALAQFLYYYKYPEHSVGTGSYTAGTSVINQQELNTAFRWSALRESYTASAYSATVRAAIGELMRDCGYAVNMSYGISASGCYPNDVATALVRNFQFDTLTVNYARRDYYTDEEWMPIIYNELAQRRPVLYTGTDGGYGGHIFVLSGVDENGLIYCNWGWNGDGNGFFDLDDLVVDNILGVEETDFSEEQHMIFGAHPTREVSPADYVYSRWVTPANRYTLTSRNANQITLGVSEILNHNYLVFKGKIMLVFASDEGTTHEVEIPYFTENMPETGAQPFGGFLVKEDLRIDVSAVPAGKYRLYLASKEVGESRPQHIRCMGTGALEYSIEKYEAGSITIFESRIVNAVSAPTATGIAEGQQPAARYTLRGQRITAPQRGLNIVRQPDGTTRKVLVK